jgi:hypothetical protein
VLSTSGDPSPELAIVIITRLARHYRSELTPLTVTAALAYGDTPQ